MNTQKRFLSARACMLTSRALEFFRNFCAYKHLFFVWRGIRLLSGSDTGSSGIKPASSVVVQTLSSSAVRPATPQDVQCMGYFETTPSVICLVVPHSQFDEVGRPYLHNDE